MVDNIHYHQNAWIELGRRHNMPITPDYYRTHIHARGNDTIARTIFGDDITPEFIKTIGDEKEAIYRETYRPVLKEIPGLMRLVKELYANNIPLAAASNSPAPNVDMVLDELNIRKFFPIAINRDQVKTGKPNPDLLLKAAKELNYPPQKCLVFEDSASGFKAAQNANMPCIAITTGTDPKELPTAKSAIQIHKDFTTITLKDLQDLF